MKTKAPSIVSRIAAAIPRRHTGVRPWWERVDAEHVETLAAIHAAWHRGEFGPRKRTAARYISKALGELGIVIGEQGVETWLENPLRS